MGTVVRYICFDCNNDRVETGAVKFGDDWTGLFIRGDDCIRMMQSLEYMLSRVNADPNSIEFKIYNSYLEMLIEEIKTNVLSRTNETNADFLIRTNEGTKRVIKG